MKPKLAQFLLHISEITCIGLGIIYLPRAGLRSLMFFSSGEYQKCCLAFGKATATIMLKKAARVAEPDHSQVQKKELTVAHKTVNDKNLCHLFWWLGTVWYFVMGHYSQSVVYGCQSWRKLSMAFNWGEDRGTKKGSNKLDENKDIFTVWSENVTQEWQTEDSPSQPWTVSKFCWLVQSDFIKTLKMSRALTIILFLFLPTFPAFCFSLPCPLSCPKMLSLGWKSYSESACHWEHLKVLCFQANGLYPHAPHSCLSSDLEPFITRFPNPKPCN